MQYFLFLVFIVVVIVMLPKIPFIRSTGLSTLQIRLLFIFKLLSGVVCAYYFQEIANSTDYLANNRNGRLQYELLISKPSLYFTDFTMDIRAYGFGGLLESSNSFWANLRSNLLYKLSGILDVLTRGNFYLNTIAFCTLVFFGNIAFFRIYGNIYKRQKLLLLFACFCLPSLLFYTSCIHKDGIIFICMGFLGYTFFQFLTDKKNLRFIHLFFFAASIAVVFLFRNYLLVALVPAMLMAWLTNMTPLKTGRVLFTGYLFFVILFFVSGFSRSSLNLPAAVVKRKADFAALGEANTNIPMKPLYPTFKSFAVNLPQAINHSLFRPWLWEFSNPAVILTALELFFYQVIILLFLFFRKKNTVVASSFNLFGFAFFINMMLIIGYTIPNIGAIVRYRSVFWVFLICPLLCNIDWKRLPYHNKPSTGNT